MSHGKEAADRPRSRDLGIAPGVYSPGAWNAITDVAEVRVGHVTLHDGDRVRTGATAIVPHSGNVFQQKIPAAIIVANGFGKLIGSTQVEELGQLETPILLTNTLNVWEAAATLAEVVLDTPGNESVRSVNPVVGETNDGWLNDIRQRPLTKAHFRTALESAKSGHVEEGSVGAGTGTIAFGYKGGIGTSSRQVSVGDQQFVVGVLVQTNFGGRLTIDGVPVWRDPQVSASGPRKSNSKDGSCMIVVATDAPLDARQLKRMARRTFVGMGRAGGNFSHGSGDYAIAFSTAKSVRIAQEPGTNLRTVEVIDDARITPLFEAAADATEESIYNSLLRASTVRGRDGHVAEAISVDRVKKALEKRTPSKLPTK